MNSIRLPSQSERLKRAKLIYLLDDGVVSIGVITGAPGVDLPASRDGHIFSTLNLSRAYNLDTFDVGLTEIKASLSFGSERYLCVIPWDAVFEIEGAAHPSPPLDPVRCRACGEEPLVHWRASAGAPPLKIEAFELVRCRCEGDAHRAPSGLVRDSRVEWIKHHDPCENKPDTQTKRI